MIVHYLPAERIDDLVAATGFNLGRTDFEYKYRWLLERIAMLRDAAERANIVHDNPAVSDLVSVIQAERRYSDALRSSIAGLQAELESLRKRD